MAAMGLKPVAEIQFTGFIYPAVDQIVNHASRLRHRTRGRLSCPVVVRAPCGGGIHAPEHHSESPEAMFAHMPGLRVVKVTGFVASAAGFTAQPAVVDGASRLLGSVFGDAGRHARSAVGVAALPLDSPVEVELTLALP